MTMQAVQSALAIRRQRSRRQEQRRAKARRHSSQSDNLMLSPSGSTLRGSSLSLSKPSYGELTNEQRRRKNLLSTKVMGTVTTFHVGIVFVMIGLMLIISSLVPGYINRDWQELLGTGCFLTFIGVLLLVINRVVSAKEEKQFSKNIKRKLAISKMNGPSKLLIVTSQSQADCSSLIKEAPQLEIISEECKELPQVHQQAETTTTTATHDQVKLHVEPS